jgi:hypothetical protein
VFFGTWHCNYWALREGSKKEVVYDIEREENIELWVSSAWKSGIFNVEEGMSLS